MRRFLEAQFARVHPLFEKGGRFHRLWPVYEGAETFALTPGTKTRQGAHLRDPMDMKRLMIMVWFAIVPCLLVGMWSIGHQAYLFEGMEAPPLVQSMLRGAWHMLPIIIVSYAVGGTWELLFCVVRGHEINEGFLVTALLFPLTLAPTTPLWMVAMGISFGVVIGKEVFGGVGYNILNPALTARAFVFFAYPAAISGASIWDVSGQGSLVASAYASAPVDGYTGATPLLQVASAEPGTSYAAALEAGGWTWMDLFLGTVPGSMGEVSALAALIGAAFLVAIGIASWRIIAGSVIGLVAVAALTNALAGPESLALMTIPPHFHLVMGSFAFGAAFMATDPVSGASTWRGQWLYGFGIGALTVVIRVFNPAYPEGVMLAILFMNVFAPLIDYYVIRGTTRARAKRLASA